MAVELKSETIRAALATALALSRNLPLSDLGEAVFKTVMDGAAEKTDEFINPVIVEWTMKPVVLIVVPGEDASSSPDAALAAEIGTVLTAVAAITDGLGGLVSDIRVNEPDFAPRALWGAVNRKGAELELEIDYWSSSLLG